MINPLPPFPLLIFGCPCREEGQVQPDLQLSIGQNKPPRSRKLSPPRPLPAPTVVTTVTTTANTITEQGEP